MHDEVPPIEPAEAARPLLDPFIQAEVNSDCILTITCLTYGSPGAQVPIKVLRCMGQVERHSVALSGLRLSLSLMGGSRILCTMAAA